jgi:hypothetical protein
MNWQKGQKGWTLPKHPAVLMEGVPWDPGDKRPGFTAMCLKTHDVGSAGPDACFVVGGYKPTEANMMRLAVHMLDCNCGWTHEITVDDDAP